MYVGGGAAGDQESLVVERTQQSPLDINLRPELDTVVARTQRGLLHVPESPLHLLHDLGQPGEINEGEKHHHCPLTE